MNGQSTAQSNREAGYVESIQDSRNFRNPNHIWNVEYHKIVHWNQPTHVFIKSGTIEMFWISGTSSFVSLPNLPRTRKILTKKGICPCVPERFHDRIYPNSRCGSAGGAIWERRLAVSRTWIGLCISRTKPLSLQANRSSTSRSSWIFFLSFRRMDFRGKGGSPLTP